MVGLLGIGCRVPAIPAKRSWTARPRTCPPGCCVGGRPVPAARRVGSGDARRTRPLDGRIRRWRFALGCVPPRSAAAVGTGRRRGVGDDRGRGRSVGCTPPWPSGTGSASATGSRRNPDRLLSAPPRRERPAPPARVSPFPACSAACSGALAWLTMTGFTFHDVICRTPRTGSSWCEVIGVPFVVGAAGSLWARDPVMGHVSRGWPPSRQSSACRCTAALAVAEDPRRRADQNAG